MCVCVCVREREREGERGGDKERGLTARFPGSVHGDFDGAVVGGHLWRSGENGDGQSEALSCSTTCP